MTKAHRSDIAAYRRASAEYLSAPSENAKRLAGEKVLRLRGARLNHVFWWRVRRLAKRPTTNMYLCCAALTVAVVLTAWGVDARRPYRGYWRSYPTLEILPVVLLIALGASFPLACTVSAWRRCKTSWAWVFATQLSLFLMILLLALLRSRPR